jgi:hypothetical protein
MSKRKRLHYVIPDCQVKPGYSVEYLTHIGRHILHKRPEVIVCLGDFADMESLSSWDKGKKSFEGRRYTKDIAASHLAMQALLRPIREHNLTCAPEDYYRPERMVLTLGNHEDRITRAVNSNAEFDGLMSVDHLDYASYGWQVVPFLEPITIDGVAYCHYFTSGVMGRPVGSAQALLSKKHMSCVAGHQQGKLIADTYRADGKRICALIMGSAYEHNEDYLGPQGNRHFRGIVMLHDVNEGEFIEQPITLKHISEKWAQPNRGDK